ncbi:hypothetical protein LTR05_000465 [Lithohypha guttulata]|uniref:Uncharacterized protein n=1 Tax=Lithohypha guttulata TaxID=1690604 RepID=A0AAN7T5B1_9EURO|nr:hypothetical protein LTR05_000465 [Lithohypha guttulata]
MKSFYFAASIAVVSAAALPGGPPDGFGGHGEAHGEGRGNAGWGLWNSSSEPAIPAQTSSSDWSQLTCPPPQPPQTVTQIVTSSMPPPPLQTVTKVITNTLPPPRAATITTTVISSIPAPPPVTKITTVTSIQSAPPPPPSTVTSVITIENIHRQYGHRAHDGDSAASNHYQLE